MCLIEVTTKNYGGFSICCILSPSKNGRIHCQSCIFISTSNIGVILNCFPKDTTRNGRIETCCFVAISSKNRRSISKRNIIGSPRY